MKPPTPNEENPEELTYGFSFRENADTNGEWPQLWYRVGRILDFEDAEDAKSDMKEQLAHLTEQQRENANKLVKRDEVDVLVGTVHSGVALGMAKVARDNKTLMIIPNAGADDLTGPLCAPNVFRSSFSNWRCFSAGGIC